MSDSDLQSTPQTYNDHAQHTTPNNQPEGTFKKIIICLSSVKSLFPLWLLPLFQSPPHITPGTYLSERYAIQLSYIVKVAGKAYHLLLLHLPELYAGRARSFAESLPTPTGTPQRDGLLASFISEWKKLNVASALIFTADLAILQFQGAFSYIDVRTVGFLSLACAFASLVYGHLLIFCFGAFVVGSENDSCRWMELAEGQSRCMWWNLSILVALPAIWTGWSAIVFVLCLLLFLWHTDMTDATLSDALLARGPPFSSPATTFAGGLTSFLIVTGLFVIVGLYLLLAVRSLRSTWGNIM